MATKEQIVFWKQRYHSKRRGILFDFTFDQWVAWWKEQLGPDWFSKRGIKAHQFCMARKGDVGPYSPTNVICITMAQNTFDAHVGKPSGMLGKKHSPETKAKIGAGQIGVPASYGMLGKKHSPETKAKMRASALARST